MYYQEDEHRAPQVISSFTLGVSLVVHIVFFTVLAMLALVHFKPKETVIPINLTVVVNENLDGVEDEPPPLNNPEPKPPSPPPEPKPAPEEPPKIEPKQEAVEMIKEEPKKEEKPKVEEKPKEKPKPKVEEKPKEKPPEKPKTDPKKEREERIKKMRESAKLVKNEVKNVPSGNGKTSKKTLSDAEIRKLLNAGYKPGTSEQLATSDMQLGVSLIQMALNDQWERLSPAIGAEGTVLLSVKFAVSGRMTDVRLAQSCGDTISDRAALNVAKSVGIIKGLPPDFIAKYSKESLTIRYKVVRR